MFLCLSRIPWVSIVKMLKVSRTGHCTKGQCHQKCVWVRPTGIQNTSMLKTEAKWFEIFPGLLGMVGTVLYLTINKNNGTISLQLGIPEHTAGLLFSWWVQPERKTLPQECPVLIFLGPHAPIETAIIPPWKHSRDSSTDGRSGFWAFSSLIGPIVDTFHFIGWRLLLCRIFIKQ